ncbi:MAG TPA: hypothetical protein VHZ76_04290 [Gammaproteobacteria bacterium]|nr:hypothetical protein [Gammaproteobacteria bacterium]
MQNECPECGKSLAAKAKYCSCGWRNPGIENSSTVDYRCHYVTCGRRCPLPGGISSSVFGSTWYCAGHWRTLDDPQEGEAVLLNAEKNYNDILKTYEDWRKKLLSHLHKKGKNANDTNNRNR